MPNKREGERELGGLIGTVLGAAWLLSLLKLTLLPRWVRAGILVVSTLPALVFREALTGFNLKSLDRFLSHGEMLKDFCALVVIQELLALLAGLSLLKERELGEKEHWWKYASLLPSVLLPAGVMYLTALGFNTLVRYEFSTILWWTAGGFVLVSVLGCELLACLRPTEQGRISGALTASWMLVLLAVFLPAAAEGRLSEGGDGQTVNWFRDLLILGSLAGVTGISALGFQLYRTRKDSTQSCTPSRKF